MYMTEQSFIVLLHHRHIGQMRSRGDYPWQSAEGSRAVSIPSAATELLGSPRHSTTRSYCGDAFNRFRCIQTVCEDMATPGELFSDEILSCLDQEDSEKELDLLMLAASQQYKSANAPPTTTDNNSVRASTTRPTTTTTAVVPSHFAPPKTMRMLPNRSRRPGQRDLLKKILRLDQ